MYPQNSVTTRNMINKIDKLILLCIFFIKQKFIQTAQYDIGITSKYGTVI